MLILQCRGDVIAPVSVGKYVHAAIPGSAFVMLDATGHCPNLTAPEATIVLELVHADGRRIPVLVNAVADRGDDGRTAGIQFAIFMAAERRGYEQGLLQARTEAEATIVIERADADLREQFIAVLRHDLRNPLASITSGIHMLDKESLRARGKKVTALWQAASCAPRF